MKIQESVANSLATRGTTVESMVVAKLVDIEIDSRVETVMSALSLQEAFEKNLKKIQKPDTITYVGEVKHEAMSESRFKEIKTITEKLDKLDKLVTDALESNTTESYNKLNEFVESNKKQG